MVTVREGSPGAGPLQPMFRLTRMHADGKLGVSFFVTSPEALARVQTALEGERHQVYAVSTWGAL